MSPEIKSVLFLVGFMLLFGFLLNLGCAAPESHKYQLNNGEVVICNGAVRQYCGMHLYHCSNGKMYDCQTNVTELNN